MGNFLHICGSLTELGAWMGALGLNPDYMTFWQAWESGDETVYQPYQESRKEEVCSGLREFYYRRRY